MSDSKPLYYATHWSKGELASVGKIRPRITMRNVDIIDKIDTLNFYKSNLAWVKNTHLIYKQYGRRVFYMAVGDNHPSDVIVFGYRSVLFNMRTGVSVRFRKLHKLEWMFMI